MARWSYDARLDGTKLDGTKLDRGDQMTADADATAPGTGTGKIKVWFRFEPRAGWLPFDTEGLWAVPLSADTATIASAPFLQDGISEGDVIRFAPDDEGVNWAIERVTASGNVAIRILPIPDGPLGPDASEVHARLAGFGLSGEAFSPEFPLVAITIPADAPMGEIKAVLARGEAEGWWYWEMGCSTRAWSSA